MKRQSEVQDDSNKKSKGDDRGPRPPVYSVRDGMRWVEPYDYVHRVGVRERWAGKALLQVFKDEFAALPASYYEAAIANGRIRVNGRVSKPTHFLASKEKIQHRQHVHEPPVTAGPISISQQKDDLYVVNKPPSMPVHPTGLYRHNTVVGILAKENGLTDLYPSGLLLVARNAEYAAHLSELIQSREVQKEYLARVLGKFPEGEVVCDKPIEKPNFKDARCRVCATGQSAVTRFERIAYDGHTSLVRCMPLTGRNHQIRVHLLHLGHPIANDPIYASAPPAPAAAALPATEPAITSEFVRADVKPLEIKCAVCETTVEIHDTQHMLIWLHALSYRISPTEVYSVPPPAWASADATYPLYAPATGLSDKLPLPK